MKTIWFLQLNGLLTGLNSSPHTVEYMVLFNQFTIPGVGPDSYMVSF